MEKIIECVPNFSEGRNKEILYKIKSSLKNINNCKLLNFEADYDYNRSVATFIGDEEGVLNGAVAISREAAKNINMRNHKGEHPRLGAIDVVPFIPIKNSSIKECIKISEIYAEIISKDLNIPVYLYESSARISARKNLAEIRKGEYENLPEKLKIPEWYPDYGPAEFNPELGAVITGARNYLIAYNININSKDVSFAKIIAENIRESGKPKRDMKGEVVKINGLVERESGKFKHVKAIGISLPFYGITQVSMNLTDYKSTGIYTVFEAVKKEAGKLGVEVSGSEIIGLVPLDALLETGAYYAEGREMNEEQLVDHAIEKTGLNTLMPFDKRKKIIDYLI